MDPLASLNPSQRDAVVHTQGALLILAGAGSGKTRVITTRIAHLVANGHATPGEILAVTFTNKAAEEMRGRVEELLGSDCRQVWLSTFHALCARLLRREAPAIGLTRDFVIYDSSDQIAVVKQALRANDIDDKMLTPRAALSRISAAKNRLETPAEMKSSGWSLRDQQVSKVYETYLRVLNEAGALDFDDLLLKTVELMETSERVRDFYSRKFRYILIAEYQDTNRPQYMLIKRLADHHRNLCVVGDPDQSIYKWRGADLRNILDFDDLLLKTVELMETSERVREFYARKFRYILIDEYQDTNRPQYMLIKRLADHHRNLCVVGDPDQSIYKWRGADLRNILDFEQDFPEATVVKLEQNYRSTQVILDAASAVISRNRNRKEKRLWTDRLGGEPIVYVRAGDEIEEADYITRAIRETRLLDIKAMTAILSARTPSHGRLKTR